MFATDSVVEDPALTIWTIGDMLAYACKFYVQNKCDDKIKRQMQKSLHKKID